MDLLLCVDAHMHVMYSSAKASARLELGLLCIDVTNVKDTCGHFKRR